MEHALKRSLLQHRDIEIAVRSYAAQRIVCAKRLPFFYADPVQMIVDAFQFVSVAHKHKASVIRILSDLSHLSRGRNADAFAGFRRELQKPFLFQAFDGIGLKRQRPTRALRKHAVHSAVHELQSAKGLLILTRSALRPLRLLPGGRVDRLRSLRLFKHKQLQAD